MLCQPLFTSNLFTLLYLGESCPPMCLLHSDTVNDNDLRALFTPHPIHYREDWMSFRIWQVLVPEAAQLPECGVEKET